MDWQYIIHNLSRSLSLSLVSRFTRVTRRLYCATLTRMPRLDKPPNTVVALLGWTRCRCEPVTKTAAGTPNHRLHDRRHDV